ncbi:MAG: hypothetical protein PUD07_03265 [bacterium]|nr:hypothetical protein [bacterium]
MKNIKLDKIYFWSVLLIMISLISNYFAKIYINNGVFSFIFSLICVVFSKCGLPLFIMILGLYLYNKKFNLKDYIKDIIKIFLLYILFTIIFMIIYNIKLTNFYLYLLSPINSVAKILLIVLCLYIFYPFVNKLVDSLNKDEIKLLSILIIIYLVLNLVGPFIVVDFNLPFINNLIYFIIGELIYLNKNKLNTKKIKKFSIIINIIMFIYLIIITYLLSNNGLYFRNTLINNSNLLIVSYSISLFYLLLNCKGKFNYENYSKYLFLVLLISMIIFEFLTKNYLIRNYYSFIMIPLLFIVVYFSSFCISYILINLYNFIRRKHGKKC